MSWAVGFDDNWKRDIGYGVPSICDHPDCDKEIDRGLSYVCGGEPWGGEAGCGLYFCSEHLVYAGPEGEQVCERCAEHKEPFEPTPDTLEWKSHKKTDASWAKWREAYPEEAAAL